MALGVILVGEVLAAASTVILVGEALAAALTVILVGDRAGEDGGDGVGVNGEDAV